MSIKYNIATGVKRAKSKTKRFSYGLLTLVFALSTLAVTGGIVLANGGWHHWSWKRHHKNIITVKPSDLALPPGPTTLQKTWYFYNDNTDIPSTVEVPGLYEFVTGIGDPPLGFGSLKFTPGAADRRFWRRRRRRVGRG